MLGKKFMCGTLLGAFTLSSVVGCGNWSPAGGYAAAGGGIIGGVGGFYAGGRHHRIAGSIIGALIGAGAGYVIGASIENGQKPKEDDVKKANEKAHEDPATTDDVSKAQTADLNGDGFVTSDELVAMSKSGLSDDEIVKRLEATHQVFDLSADQKKDLAAQGVSTDVVAKLDTINQQQYEQAAVLTARNDRGTDTGIGDR